MHTLLTNPLPTNPLRASRIAAIWSLTCLRQVVTLAGLAALSLLAACGGGNGAPNNPYEPPAPTPVALSVLPASGNVYPGTPITLTVSGGTAPYRAFSSNPAVLPVALTVANSTVVLSAVDVSADTTVVVTVQDAAGQITQSTLVVRPSPLFPSGLVVIPSSNACGANSLCSGATGIASIQATGAAGSPAAGQRVKFDVIYGAFGIASSNPAQPLVQTLTVVADGSGKAAVGIQSAVNATTQPAQIRATAVNTDGTLGQQVIANFTIVNSSDPAGSITIVPEKATITGAFINVCTTGFQIDYFIYGGTPPYRVSSTFPQAVSLLNSTVNTSGGSFSAVTNGTCVNPLTFTIVDAAGKQITALLENLPGTATPPVVTPTALQVTPNSYSVSGNCTTRSYTFAIVGGTPPYNVTATAGTPQPPTVTTMGGTTTIVGANGATGSVVVVDAGVSQQSSSATFTCTP